MSWLSDLFGKKSTIPINRSMWVWYLAPSDTDNLLAFCGNKQINEIYLCVDLNVDNALLKAFITNAHSKNIKVQYLDGLQVKGTENPSEAITRVKAIMSKANWDGVHLDWEIGQGCPTITFNGLLEEVLKELKDYNVIIDLEYWREDMDYFRIVNDYVDSMVVMGYANNYWDTRGKVQKGLNKVKIPWKFGIETGDDLAFKDVSFWNLGESKMGTVISQVDSWARSKQGYQGLGLHHWDSIRRLKK